MGLANETSGTSGEERLDRYITGQTRIAADSDGFLMFFDLLPYVIRDERLRTKLAATYDWYYRMNVEWLGLTDRVNAESRSSSSPSWRSWSRWWTVLPSRTHSSREGSTSTWRSACSSPC